MIDRLFYIQAHRNWHIFIPENAYEYVIDKLVAILSRLNLLTDTFAKPEISLADTNKGDWVHAPLSHIDQELGPVSI